MRLTIAYSKIKKQNLVLINNDTYQRETLSEPPIRQPLIHVDREYLGDSVVCRNPDKPVVNAIIKNTKLLYQNDSNLSVWMCSERSTISNKI